MSILAGSVADPAVLGKITVNLPVSTLSFIVAPVGAVDTVKLSSSRPCRV